MKVEKCLSWEDEEKALKYLGEGWIGEEAVALALYCFLKYPDSYEKMVIRRANTNGDSDSVACIGGSISGAYLGIDAIPGQWVEKIEKSECLYGLAIRLAGKNCLSLRMHFQHVLKILWSMKIIDKRIFSLYY